MTLLPATWRILLPYSHLFASEDPLQLLSKAALAWSPADGRGRQELHGVGALQQSPRQDAGEVPRAVPKPRRPLLPVHQPHHHHVHHESEAAQGGPLCVQVLPDALRV